MIFLNNVSVRFSMGAFSLTIDAPVLAGGRVYFTNDDGKINVNCANGSAATQKRLADMLTAITQAQLLVWRLGQLKESGQLQPAQVSLAKRANVAMALDVARSARGMLGAAGVTLDFQSGRHLCNLESVSTYEGTHDIHTLVLGQELTGLSAF